MALNKKTINGNVCWCPREMARVDGKSKVVYERYLGSAKDINKLLESKKPRLCQRKPGT